LLRLLLKALLGIHHVLRGDLGLLLRMLLLMLLRAWVRLWLVMDVVWVGRVVLFLEHGLRLLL
jgi:hypothetical protein